MQTQFQKCKSAGDIFEDKVADIFAKHGFSIYRNLYVPYHPGDTSYAEVDIVAVNSQMIIAVECKYLHGTLSGEMFEPMWLLANRYGARRITNIFRQNNCHRWALEANTKLPIKTLVVIPDRLAYKAAPVDTVVRFSNLDEVLCKMLTETETNSVLMDMENSLRRLFASFTRPNTDVKKSHILTVNSSKNIGVTQAVEKLEGVPKFCVLVDGCRFYVFTDDNGVHHDTTRLSDASLFDVEDDAWLVASTMSNGEVCTLSLGGIELVCELPTELDNMSAAEYADAVGARPW